MNTDVFRWVEPAAKRLVGRPQEALLCAKAKRQRQMFSVATATKRPVVTEINQTLWS
ncbi:hypothetical protein [Lysinibacillus xylanilyticus]|uniref:hypothetical protein n=1 Tax=Lysinibacillus xylanilyticus TaxID=582475 RepID=UPI003CFC71E8